MGLKLQEILMRRIEIFLDNVEIKTKICIVWLPCIMPLTNVHSISLGLIHAFASIFKRKKKSDINDNHQHLSIQVKENTFLGTVA